MLSVFPNLLDYGLLAPLLLRMGIGVLFLVRGIDLIKEKDNNIPWKSFWQKRIAENRIQKVVFVHGIVQCIIAAAFIFGFLTQIAAILALILTLIEWQKDNESNLPKDTNRKFSHIFAVLICFSLLFLGAGFLAIDLPL